MNSHTQLEVTYDEYLSIFDCTNGEVVWGRKTNFVKGHVLEKDVLNPLARWRLIQISCSVDVPVCHMK